MSAQSTPIITAPLPMLPIPIDQWKRGQTIGQFLDELQVRYQLTMTCDGVRLIRKH